MNKKVNRLTDLNHAGEESLGGWYAVEELFELLASLHQHSHASLPRQRVASEQTRVRDVITREEGNRIRVHPIQLLAGAAGQVDIVWLLHHLQSPVAPGSSSPVGGGWVEG